MKKILLLLVLTLLASCATGSWQSRDGNNSDLSIDSGYCQSLANSRYPIYICRNITWCEPDETSKAINSLNQFNPNTTAILNKKYEKHIKSFNLNSNTKIDLIDYSPNRLVYSVDSKESSLAVFSEIFYPKGWIAYVDGIHTDHFPINYILRGLFIPSGTQEIIFEFKPKSFFISAKIAFFSSCLLIITCLMTFGRLFLFKQ